MKRKTVLNGEGGALRVFRGWDSSARLEPPSLPILGAIASILTIRHRSTPLVCKAKFGGFPISSWLPKADRYQQEFHSASVSIGRPSGFHRIST